MKKNLFSDNFYSLNNITQSKLRLFLLFVGLFFSTAQVSAAFMKDGNLPSKKSSDFLRDDNFLNDDRAELNIVPDFSDRDVLPISTKDSITANSSKTTIVNSSFSKKMGSRSSGESHSSKTAASSTNSTEANSTATIFITPGTMMIGEANIYNAKIVEKKEQIIQVLKKEKKSSLALQIDVIKAKKKEEISVAKKAQEKAVQKNTDFSFTTFPTGDADFRNQSPHYYGAVVPPFQFSHFAIIIAPASEITKISKELKNQKFRTSLSYLQFGKLRNSFLRGPPSLS